MKNGCTYSFSLAALGAIVSCVAPLVTRLIAGAGFSPNSLSPITLTLPVLSALQPATGTTLPNGANLQFTIRYSLSANSHSAVLITFTPSTCAQSGAKTLILSQGFATAGAQTLLANSTVLAQWCNTGTPGFNCTASRAGGAWSAFLDGCTYSMAITCADCEANGATAQQTLTSSGMLFRACVSSVACMLIPIFMLRSSISVQLVLPCE